MQSTSSESNVQQEDRRSRRDKLIDLLRSRPRERFPQLPLQIDDNGIVPLPREPVLFTLDREGERVNNTEENFVCPEKLEDMLVIVRNLREQRQRAFDIDHRNNELLLQQLQVQRQRQLQMNNNYEVQRKNEDTID